MTTYALPTHQDRARDTDSAVEDRATRGMSHHPDFLADPLDLLDHRTRERMISPAAAPSGRYLAVEHDGETFLIPLDRSITHIGRGLVADLRVEDSHVSRRHAILAIAPDPDGAVSLLDDRSSNGTFVNGQAITTHRLHDGDVVRVGRAVFRYVEVAPRRRRAEPLRRIPLGALRQSARPGHRSPALRRVVPA